jgi:hypothetical protein
MLIRGIGRRERKCVFFVRGVDEGEAQVKVWTFDDPIRAAQEVEERSLEPGIAEAESGLEIAEQRLS